MLDEDLKSQLKAYLGHLKGPVHITSYLGEGEPSRLTEQLLDDIRTASSLVTVQSGDPTGKRVPSFAIHRLDEEPRVTFAGLPLGHEFTSLVLALLHVSGHPPKVSEASLTRAKNLKTPLKFETYFSQSCQNCPDVVQALNLMAANNPLVEHVAIDGASFSSEVEERQIMAVPTIFLNGEPFGQGRMELDEVLAQVDSSLVEERAQELSQKEPFDMLIVGGGPAGAA